MLLIIISILSSILLSVTFTILLLKRKYDRRLSDFQDSVLKKQRDEVQNIYQTMRAWRHDYHNHIQSIKAMLAMKKFRELDDYLGTLEQDLDSIDIAIRTGNVSLDAILSSKVSIARKNNIEVNCTAKVPGELKITDVHLCAIVGNLLDNAIEACEKIKAKNPNVRCLLVGPYDSNPSSMQPDELQKFIDNGVIEYFGEQSDVIPYLAQCNVFVLPSYREGTPKTVLEAMACGRACITTDAPGCRETVDDKENGLLVPIKDVNALADAMQYMIDNPKEMSIMAQNGRQKAERVFDVNKVNEIIIKTMKI